MITGRRECECRNKSVVLEELVGGSIRSPVTQDDRSVGRYTSDVLAVRGECDARDGACMLVYCFNVLSLRIRWSRISVINGASVLLIETCQG